MTSNLPPGIGPGDLPGNRTEDVEFEHALNTLCDEVILSDIDARDILCIWKMGLAAWNAAAPHHVAIAIETFKEHQLNNPTSD